MTPSTIFQPVNNVQLPSQQGDTAVVQETIQVNGGDALIGFSASGWAASGGTMLSFSLWLDGQPTGGQLQMYANAGQTHLSLGHSWVYCPALEAGSHAVTIVAGPGTVTDQNDTACLTVWEMGDGCAVRFAADLPCPSGTGQVLVKEAVGTKGGQLLVSESASGWVTSANQLVTARTTLDDDDAAVATQVFANNASEHLATVPTDFAHTDATNRGQHLVQMVADGQVSTDGGDTAHIAVVEWVNAPDAPVICAMNPPLVGAVANSQQGDGGSIAQSQFSKGDGTLLVKVGVSVWTNNPQSQLSVGIQIDGTSLGFAQIFANPGATHMTCVTNDLVLTGVPAGTHTLNLMAERDVITDNNDRVSVLIMEFPPS
jgi:hypothetical protein